MSNLLKEAIIDAKALREAALKNAESAIIDKYSNEVRETLNKLLEQDEFGDEPLPADPAAGLPADEELPPMPDIDAELDAPGNTASTPEEVVDGDVGFAGTDGLSEMEGENLRKFSEEGEQTEVNIDLGALQEAVRELGAELGEDEEIEITAESILEALSESEENEVIEEEEEELEEATTAGAAAAQADAEQLSAEEGDSTTDDKEDAVNAGTMASTNEEVEEDSEIVEVDMDTLVDSIMEKLTVDMGADLSGWAGRPSEQVKHEMERELAHRRSTDVEEDLKNLKKAQEELVFENNQLSEQNNQYKQAVQELKEGLQDVNLSNARLLYTNRVLRNTSLNERQKEKIVEAISGAGSVTEARTIYETLQSTVEAAPKKSPQSLSEAITRRSSVLRASRKESTPSDPFSDRMRRLAGIK